MPLVSVIIPVYNTQDYLPRCLDSVLGQTLEDLEVVLVDDGSTDGSSAICDAYARTDRRIKLIHQANSGAAAARNAGLAVSTGENIGFLDSDDWVSADTYAYLLQLMEQYQAPVAEAMLEVAFSADHRLRQLPEQVEAFEGDDILVRYFRHNEFAMGLRLYRRQLFDGVCFEAGRINEDVVTGYLVLRNANRLVASNQPKYFYFSNPSGVSESPLKKQDWDLLHAGQRLDELTRGTANQELRCLALTKCYRAPFTLLVKLALFGCNDELDRHSATGELKAGVRQNYRWLMSSSMPLNRKLLLTACRFCYPLVRLMGAVYRAIRAVSRQ